MTQYDVSTLDGIAAIPQDRLPAFFAELPTMLSLVRNREAFTRPTEHQAVIWIDDGKDDVAFEFA